MIKIEFDKKYGGAWHVLVGPFRRVRDTRGHGQGASWRAHLLPHWPGGVLDFPAWMMRQLPAQLSFCLFRPRLVFECGYRYALVCIFISVGCTLFLFSILMWAASCLMHFACSGTTRQSFLRFAAKERTDSPCGQNTKFICFSVALL